MRRLVSFVPELLYSLKLIACVTKRVFDCVGEFRERDISQQNSGESNYERLLES